MEGIKRAVHTAAPDATVLLYGSYARGDNNAESDIDLLVLLDRDRITFGDRAKITHALYPLELEAGIHISPLLRCKKEWYEKRVSTPFYENVIREGIVL